MAHTEALNILRMAVADPGSLPRCIARFQNLVWDDDSDLGGDDEILRELAHDLDFYEPDPKARAEDTTLFGEEEALKRIGDVLQSFGDEYG